MPQNNNHKNGWDVLNSIVEASIRGKFISILILSFFAYILFEKSNGGVDTFTVLGAICLIIIIVLVLFLAKDEKHERALKRYEGEIDKTNNENNRLRRILKKQDSITNPKQSGQIGSGEEKTQSDL